MFVEHGDLQESGQLAEKLADNNNSETNTSAPHDTAQYCDELSTKKLPKE